MKLDMGTPLDIGAKTQVFLGAVLSRVLLDQHNDSPSVPWQEKLARYRLSCLCTTERKVEVDPAYLCPLVAAALPVRAAGPVLELLTSGDPLPEENSNG